MRILIDITGKHKHFIRPDTSRGAFEGVHDMIVLFQIFSVNGVGKFVDQFVTIVDECFEETFHQFLSTYLIEAVDG